MNKEEYKKYAEEHEDWAPGWDAIDKYFEKLYFYSYFVIPSFIASSATALATTLATLSSNAPGMM